MFVDHIQVHVQAGKGGRGCVSFRREKFIPKGGPDGGNGGTGASVILRVDANVDNLTDFYYSPNLRGKHGEHGLGKNCYGRAAEDAVFHVPVGTIVWRVPIAASGPTGDSPRSDKTFVDFTTLSDDEAEAFDGPKRKRVAFDPAQFELVADLTAPGTDFVLCEGGKGGRGNTTFKSSLNRVPIEFTDGEAGEEGTFYFELRKIADAGLVGYPNAGKSTLLTRISNAHPKIAPYPFTTLTPHVGVLELDGYRRVTVADIPGLIEGAHTDVGLGHDFLRHIVRCKLLVFVLDMAGSEGREPLADLQSLRKELDLYDPTLSERPWLIVANKMDLPDAKARLKTFRTRYRKIEIIPISAEQGEGVEVLKRRLGEIVCEGKFKPE
ncbi:MAG: GTPase ObgE [Chthoniobacteraceae bacterium]